MLCMDDLRQMIRIGFPKYFDRGRFGMNRLGQILDQVLPGLGTEGRQEHRPGAFKTTGTKRVLRRRPLDELLQDSGALLAADAR